VKEQFHTVTVVDKGNAQIDKSEWTDAKEKALPAIAGSAF
jgi:hypothetical protein